MNWREKGLMQVMLDPRDVADVRELAGTHRRRAARRRLARRAGRGGPRAVPARRPAACARDYFGFPGPDPADAVAVDEGRRHRRLRQLPGRSGRSRPQSVRAGGEMIAYLRDRLAELPGRAGGTACPTTSSPGSSHRLPPVGVATTASLINMAGPAAGLRGERARGHGRGGRAAPAAPARCWPRPSRPPATPSASTATSGRRCGSTRSSSCCPGCASATTSWPPAPRAPR